MGVRRVVVMASGRGSNFAALCQAVTEGKLPNVQLVALICNIPGAGALEEAKKFGIVSHVLESKPDRGAYEKKLSRLLKELKPDLICLAGYMLLLGKDLVNEWPQKIINIHPSLLPKFKGLHAQRQALQAGEKITGCTVHYVTASLDDGPIILQNKIEILPDDTEQTLSARLLPIEHATYVEALRTMTGK